MSGIANVPKPSDVCNSMQSANVNLSFTQTEETMTQTQAINSSSVSTTSKKTTLRLSIAGLLVVLIPEGYFDNERS
jgi:hypothetical protein